MPLNGNGVYTPPSPQFPAIPGEIIYADYFNTIILDMSEALSKALYDDGQRIWAAMQNVGTYGLTGPGNFTGLWAFDTSPTMPTAAPGDNTTKGATTAFVTAAAFSAALPLQTGNAGKYVTTDGTNASWTIPVGQNLFNHYNLGGF